MYVCLLKVQYMGHHNPYHRQAQEKNLFEGETLEKKGEMTERRGKESLTPTTNNNPTTSRSYKLQQERGGIYSNGGIFWYTHIRERF